jgi:hypothetical protein
MNLTKEQANKLINVESSPVVVIPAGEFSQGDALILFNNSDDFRSIQSEIKNSYRSGMSKSFRFIEFPPRSMVNAVFIDADTVVYTRGFA